MQEEEHGSEGAQLAPHTGSTALHAPQVPGSRVAARTLMQGGDVPSQAMPAQHSSLQSEATAAMGRGGRAALRSSTHIGAGVLIGWLLLHASGAAASRVAGHGSGTPALRASPSVGIRKKHACAAAHVYVCCQAHQLHCRWPQAEL